MHPRRITALVATGVLAATGALVAAAPAAQATVMEYTSECVNDFLGSVGQVPSKYDVTISPVKDKYTVGDVVTIDWKWISYPSVPPNSPVSPVPADSTKPYGYLSLSGAQTDSLEITGDRKHPAANRGEPLLVPDMKGTFTLTTPGSVTLTPLYYKTNTDFFGTPSNTECKPIPGQAPGALATLTVEGAQTADPVISGPAESHPSWDVELTGSNFMPNAVPQVSLCAADNSGCSGDPFPTNTLKIDDQGKLSGKATLAVTPPLGSFSVRVSDGVKSAFTPLTITKYVSSEPRKATAAPSVVSIGGSTVVSGENWTGNSNVTVQAADVTGQALGASVNAFTDPYGKFVAPPLVITDPLTTQIRVREGISSTKRVFVPITVSTVPPLSQGVGVTLAPGSLSMSQAGSGIDFGSATLNGEAQTLNASLNQVTVVDARGSQLGWSLTGTMTDLVAANGTDKIPAGNIAWTPSCTAAAGSPSTVANGTAGALGSAPATLCSVTANGATSGGKFTADAGLQLTTPQFAAAGAYTGTLTLTLS